MNLLSAGKIAEVNIVVGKFGCLRDEYYNGRWFFKILGY
jgi:hypothetical protein